MYFQEATSMLPAEVPDGVQGRLVGSRLEVEVVAFTNGQLRRFKFSTQVLRRACDQLAPLEKRCIACSFVETSKRATG